jgi:hypothetical protein
MSGTNGDNRIPRHMTLGINVENVADLPKAGRQMAAFLKSVDHDHGPFEIDIVVSVNPLKPEHFVDLSSRGNSGDTIEIVFVPDESGDDEGFEEEGV